MTDTQPEKKEECLCKGKNNFQNHSKTHCWTKNPIFEQPTKEGNELTCQKKDCQICNFPHQKDNPHQPDWTKDFDKKFYPEGIVFNEHKIKDIKSFIETLLKEEREKFNQVEIIEKWDKDGFIKERIINSQDDVRKEARQSLLSEIREMANKMFAKQGKDGKSYCGCGDSECDISCGNSYNQALSEILTKLNDLGK